MIVSDLCNKNPNFGIKLLFLRLLSNNSLNIIFFLGMVIGTPVTGWLYNKTLIWIDSLLLMALISSVVIYFILVPVFKIDSKNKKITTFVISLLGFAPLVTALFLSINYILADNKQIAIIDVSFNQKQINNDDYFEWETTDKRFASYKHILDFSVYDNPFLFDKAEIVFYDGKLGFRVVSSKKLLKR